MAREMNDFEKAGLKKFNEQLENSFKKEIAFHLEAYFDGDINGDDLANAIEEVLFAHS